jgi:hypothetical protein
MRDREENNITLSNIRNAIEYSKDLTIWLKMCRSM